MNLDIVIVGLSITSSWGNGHASTYRALAKGLAKRGHRVTFLERERPWYRDHSDISQFPHCQIGLYQSLMELSHCFGAHIARADLVVLGSYVPDGATIGSWITMQARGVTAFYDIDTPVTLANLAEGTSEYVTAALIPRFDLYLSFAGGPILDVIEGRYGHPRARPLYCGVDGELHRPQECPPKWDLGYLGTYSADRQPALKRLMIEPARRLPDAAMVVCGSQYPTRLKWPANIERIEHLPTAAHPGFYCAQRYTLNITRAEMISAGYSPSVRLFEAAACGVPIISDRWTGLDTFFTPGKEIIIADVPEDVVSVLRELPDERRLDIATAARMRVLSSHTGDIRAEALEDYYLEVVKRDRSKRRIEAVA